MGPKRSAKKSGEAIDQPKPSKTITGKSIRRLRALGHHLDPVVQIGKDGITDALVDATRTALLAHELIKVRVGSESPIDRKTAAENLAARTSATLAQVLGRTFLLYKRHPQKPTVL
jgi:RNA-binding protein